MVPEPHGYHSTCRPPRKLSKGKMAPYDIYDGCGGLAVGLSRALFCRPLFSRLLLNRAMPLSTSARSTLLSGLGLGRPAESGCARTVETPVERQSMVACHANALSETESVKMEVDRGVGPAIVVHRLCTKKTLWSKEATTGCCVPRQHPPPLPIPVRHWPKVLLRMPLLRPEVYAETWRETSGETRHFSG